MRQDKKGTLVPSVVWEAGQPTRIEKTWVAEHTRKDGVVVKGHYRTKRRPAGKKTEQGACGQAQLPLQTWVNGYTRKDGTEVRGYWRARPGSTAPKKITPKKARAPRQIELALAA